MGVENDFMRTHRLPRFSWLIGLSTGVAMLCALSASSASAASTIYYCPDRKADQQYSAVNAPGCVPLVQKKEQQGDEGAGDKAQRDFQITNLQNEVNGFLAKYRQFLECCKTDLNELHEVEELGDEVDRLLASAQANLSNNSLASRGIMLHELIPRVAKARGDLKILRSRLEKIADSTRLREQMGYEEAGRESQKIRELQESIERDIRAPKLPGSAKAGAAIGVAPAAGPNIGRSPKVGADIGGEGLTGQDIGASPKSSRDIGGSGPSGFEIGATGRAGPGIGESTLNQETSSSVNSTLQRSTVGSSISDSTVNSSIRPSNIGSNMQDTSVGSTFGGSSVGSSLQDNR